MRPGELEPVLEQIRLARAGTLPRNTVPEPLASYLGHGLGHLCDLLATWIEGDRTDRRGVDATIRFYGLGRMPEPLASIASSLRSRSELPGLSSRRVQQLIEETTVRAEHRKPAITVTVKRGGVLPTSDPCPLPLTLADRRRLSHVLLWAWADAVDLPAPDGTALMLYEYEHGLRTVPPKWRTRQERQRLRHRSWAMLEVAKYRCTEAVPTDPMVDRNLGPRRSALVHLLPSDGLDALLLVSINPYAGDLREALSSVRSAVRANRPEGPELLGILRDAIVQMRNVPADVTSKILVLTAISSRVRRDPAGVVAGQQALRHVTDVLGGRRLDEVRHRHGAAVLSDALRAAQESAELSFAIGNLSGAWATMRSATNALIEYGDPEQETEPQGWRQQFLLYESSWMREFSVHSGHPRRWLDHADAAGGVSAELVFDSVGLPTAWGLAADEQRVGVALDLAELAYLNGDSDLSRRFLRLGRRRLDELEQGWLGLNQERFDEEQRNQVRTEPRRESWRLHSLRGWSNVKTFPLFAGAA